MQTILCQGPMKSPNLERLCKVLQVSARPDLGRPIWQTPGRLPDATHPPDVQELMGGELAVLALHDPPYNLVAFERRSIGEFVIGANAGGAPTACLGIRRSTSGWGRIKTRFQPLPDFMVMMRDWLAHGRSSPCATSAAMARRRTDMLSTTAHYVSGRRLNVKLNTRTSRRFAATTRR